VCVHDTRRLPQRRSTTANGSRLPTAPLTSKHVISGTTGPPTTNNNNSPPSESSAHHGTPRLDVSRDSSDVTLDPPARTRPSPAGKRPRKATSAGGRAAHPLPGHGETVDAAGQVRRGPPAAGKLSVSATNSPASLVAAAGTTTLANDSTNKLTSLTTTSTSLTDVAAKMEQGSSSPELARRKLTTSSRLAVPRASGRPPKTARPASDGGGTATGSGSYRGLGSKLPSVVTGSVGAISDSGLKTTGLTSFQSSTRKQHQSIKFDRRPAGSTSSSSGRLTELRVQFGLGHETQRDVADDLPSTCSSVTSSTTRGTADDTESHPAEQDDFRRFPDRLRDQQLESKNQNEYENVSDWPKICQSLVDSQGCYRSVSDWQNDYQSPPDEQDLPDQQGHSQNVAGNQERDQSFSGGQKSRHILTDGMSLLYGREKYQYLTDESEDCRTPLQRQGHDQSCVDKDLDRVTIEVDRDSCGRGDIDQQVVICEAKAHVSDAAVTYTDVDRTISACDDDDVTGSCETSYNSQLTVITPSTTVASSVVMTTYTTGSNYSQSTIVSGNGFVRTSYISLYWICTKVWTRLSIFVVIIIIIIIIVVCSVLKRNGRVAWL